MCMCVYEQCYIHTIHIYINLITNICNEAEFRFYGTCIEIYIYYSR